VQSSRTVIKSRLTPVRIRGRVTLEEIRARYKTATSRSFPSSRHRHWESQRQL